MAELKRTVREEYVKIALKFTETLVSRHPKVEAVVLFGSVARGTPWPTSDVDVLVIMHCGGVRSRLRRYRLIEDAIDAVEDLRLELAKRGIFTG